MRKILFALFIALVLQDLKAQVVFCPPGAEWSYSFWSMWDQLMPSQVKYVRDSVLGSETVKVLRHSRLYRKNNTVSGSHLTLLKQKGDTIYFRNRITQHTWQVLYNFGAQPSQGWQNTVSLLYDSQSSGTLTAMYSVTVDSVTNVNVNGFSLRRLYLKYWSQYSGSSGYYRSTVTERFGNDAFMFNFINKDWGWCDLDDFPKLRCYTDNAFGTRQLTELTCDFKNVGFDEEIAADSGVFIYPNPTADIININISDELQMEKSWVTIRDLSGRAIKQTPSEHNTSVNISDLAKGIYLLELSNKEKVLYRNKFVKNN